MQTLEQRAQSVLSHLQLSSVPIMRQDSDFQYPPVDDIEFKLRQPHCSLVPEIASHFIQV